MVDLKQSVLSILREHRGRASAVRGKALAAALGMNNDRLVRKAIRELIAAGYPIAATTEAPAGYYLIETKQEAEDYLRVMRSRLVDDAYRRRDFKRAAAFELEQVSQGRLI